MWISKSKYRSIQENNTRLQHEADTLRTILRAIDNAIDGTISIGDIVIMSNDTWNKINSKWQADADNVMKLTAERDWYKQKYAELITTVDIKG